MLLLFLTAFAAAFFLFVYVQFTAGRQHGDENGSSVYEPRDGRCAPAGHGA